MNSLVNKSPKEKAKMIAGISIGNALEYFDFALFTFFAIYIGHNAFPKQSETAQVLLALAIYGIGYIARPLGGVVLGRYADTKGRKAAINLTLILMAVGTCLIGIAPSYEAVGVLSPIIVILGRLVQGFSAGGETGTSTTLLAELAPPNQRNFFVSWQSASQGIAVLLASAVTLIISISLDDQAMQSWGWRIPFFIGLIIIPIGFYLRKNLEETAHIHTEDEPGKTKAAVQKVKISAYLPIAIQGMFMVLGANAAYTIINLYMPTYGVRELGLSHSVASLAALVAAVMMLVFAPIGGILSDKYGTKKVVIISRVLSLVLVYPVFLFITEHPSTLTLLCGIGFLSFIGALGGAGIFALLTELFPRGIRVTGMSIVYSIAVAIGGGFGQFIVTYLIELTGNPLAPAFYLIVIGFFSLIAILFVKDRTGMKLD